ncbi:MAG: hypothetical protein P4L85_00555 [Paludisphaera borealis]|uniref:hypothetical protein n=1 Tax=Paludisphaera borealis TaxID=1387353 RepID=UPI00284C22E1|nr:hypothetical protein [Paludisphaera borealis]MDR3617816.1 hypothetical protein [Paludisphaera borealis]
MFRRSTFLLRPLAMATGLASLVFAARTADAAIPPVGPVSSAIIGQGSYGTIKGRVVWEGDVPTPKVLVEEGKASKDPEVCGVKQPILSQELLIDPKTKGIAGALVYLSKPNGTNPEAVKALLSKNPKAVLDQKGCEFFPYIQGIYKDQPLEIKSSDSVNHNIRYTCFTNPSLNQMLGVGGHLEVKFEAERRPIMVLCDIHPWMKAYVAVFDHPFYAVSGKDGSFEIHGVPAGAQNLVVWQEKVGWINPGKAKGAPVTVAAGEAVDAGEFKIEPSQIKNP